MSLNRNLIYYSLLILSFNLTSCKKREEDIKVKQKLSVRKDVMSDLLLASKVIRTNAKLKSINERVSELSYEAYEKPIVEGIQEKKGGSWSEEYYNMTDKLNIDASSPVIRELDKKSNLIYDENGVIVMQKTLDNFNFKDLISVYSNNLKVNNKLIEFSKKLKTYAVRKSKDIVDSGSLTIEELENGLKYQISQFEDDIERSDLSLEGKQAIFETTSALGVNLGDIIKENTSLDQPNNSNGRQLRFGGFWSKVGNFFKSVAATVVYAVVAAVVTVGGLVGGFLVCGGACSAIGGVGGYIAGNYVGKKLAYLISDKPI